MRALSIRQPYAELILRGIKTVEYRSRPTRIIGEAFYIYAARTPGVAEGFALLDCQPGDLPTGLRRHGPLVRCVEVRDRSSEIRGQKSDIGGTSSAPTSYLRPLTSVYEWHLSKVKRLPRPRKPKRMPQPVWFSPFRAIGPLRRTVENVS